MLPIAIKYLNTHGLQFLGNPNHISTAKNKIAEDLAINDPEIKPFLDYLYHTCNEFLKFQRVDYKKYKYIPYIVFNKITKSGYHKMHTHPNCIVSGCFYLDVPTGSSDILFNDPRDYHKYTYLDKNFSEGNGDLNCLNPELIKQVSTGDFLMWNSWLEHEVLPNLVDSPRYTMVFNIGINL
jgi:hypothetical protein